MNSPRSVAIVPTITYNIFESLRDLNASERGHADADPGINRNDCTDSDRELDLHYIWENGRKIRLLGTLQRERAACLKPLLEARQAAMALASAAEAALIPRRPWTDQELAAVIRLNPEHRIYDHRELLGEDSIFRFQKLVWDGLCALLLYFSGRMLTLLDSEVMPIIDRTKLVIGVAGGVPQEDDGPTVTAQATAALEKALSMLPGRLSRSISAGVGYDGDRPQNLPLRVHQMFALDYLSQHVAVKRLCTFTTDLFAAFSPRSFGRAKTHTQAFFRSHPSLNRHFPGVWTNVTFDLGPTTVPSPQLASSKLRWCWLAITALGDFDADKGGIFNSLGSWAHSTLSCRHDGAAATTSTLLYFTNSR
ncbi:hypothetical protein C8R43DRAFT_953480 [Mycena crocata]|nr:hypothetical protein C8R43DRAFT_953480 [Mycena crocata]